MKTLSALFICFAITVGLTSRVYAAEPQEDPYSVNIEENLSKPVVAVKHKEAVAAAMGLLTRTLAQAGFDSRGVRDGEVTTAVRDSSAADGTPIHAGDVMGIQDGAITQVGSDVCDVAFKLIEAMQTQEEGDTLTILAGQDMDDDVFEALCDRIEDAMPDLEVDAHRGEQPLYPVIFSIE